MLNTDSSSTTHPSGFFASLYSRAAAWVLVATLTFSITACNTPSESVGASSTPSATQDKTVEIETGRAEIESDPVMKTLENPDPQEPEPLTPPKKVDPGNYGFGSLEEMKAAIRKVMDLPPELKIRLVEQERDGVKGLTVIGAGYNNEGK